MNGTWYFIEPNDVWMFRDGRPFAAGESHLIHSLFPPSALTLQGALRAWVLHNSGQPLDHWKDTPHPKVGYGDKLASFEMEGPYVAYRDDSGRITQIVPVPADVTYLKSDSFSFLKPDASVGLASFPNTKLLPLSLQGTGEVDDPPEPSWIGIDILQNLYLGGHRLPRDDNKPMNGIIYSSDLFDEEPRFGIGMDAQVRRPKDSMLYRAAFKRPKPNVGLLVKVSDVGLPETTVIGLGGEGRTARISQPDESVQIFTSDDLKTPAHTGKIKIVLLSPAYFLSPDSGDSWQPAGGWEAYLGTGATLIAAAVPRFQALGGWDFVNKRSRPMVRLVPAGAVFFFENATAPMQLCLTDNPTGFPPFDKLGFGRFAVGTW